MCLCLPHELQAACVLAGCDFLPSLKGVSFRTAAGFVARGRSLEGALVAMRAEKRFRTAVTEEYRKGAAQALAAFRHAFGEREVAGLAEAAC